MGDPTGGTLHCPLISEMNGLIESLKFNGYIKLLGRVDDPELTVFADASELAYGVCRYVRWPLIAGGYVSQLVISNNRIAPKRKLSLPRLELCAAVIAARLSQFVMKEQIISSRVSYTLRIQ